ncbi:MAG: DUF6161 domain-containing protein [Campylobacterota bacterium]
MDIKKELNIKLKELEANLENNSVQTILKERQFDINDLQNVISLYLQNIKDMNDEDLKNILTKVSELVSHSNNSPFRPYAHQFINTSRFLINNPPEVNIDTNDNLDKDNYQISEEEFSKRYDKLIESLNFEGEECNLILETPFERKPFNVFKNKNNSLVIYAKASEKPMTIAAARLLEVAFNKKVPTYTSYETVIISKIMDNSIFDFLSNESLPKDLIDAMKMKLSKNEDELLKLSSKLVDIEKNNQELSTIKESLNDTLAQSTTAKQEFENAKEAVVEYAKLNASVSYWGDKQKIHRNKFIGFGILSIVLIGLLIWILFWSLNDHDNQIKESKKTEMIIDINTTNEAKKITQDVNKSNTAIEQTLQEPKTIILNNEENSKSFDFDYSKLAWYILMIFASSSAFWIIRITVKIALSNLHLSEDAHERVVMIQTYLSFVKEGQIDKNDKKLILSSLFRPSNIGIIKDESSVTVADIITAFKSR